MKGLLHTVGIAIALIAIAASSSAATLTDAQIRQLVIQESLATYSGNCACPWNTDRAGRLCGARSAYSKPGGYSPKCFAHDVSDDEVKAYRLIHSA